MAHFEFHYTTAKTVEELAQYLNSELQAFYQALSETEALDLRVTHKAPHKPRNGLLVFADGTDWDPGAGRGLYYYDGSWVKFTADALAALAAHEAAADPHPQYSLVGATWDTI